jgi:hypothetical protein
MSITRGNADEYITDEMTVSGRDISIGISEMGYYKINVAGAGDKPDLCNHLFTSLSEARKAVSAYVNTNKAAIEKKKMIIDIAAREYPRKGKSAKTDTE